MDSAISFFLISFVSYPFIMVYYSQAKPSLSSRFLKSLIGTLAVWVPVIILASILLIVIGFIRGMHISTSLQGISKLAIDSALIFIVIVIWLTFKISYQTSVEVNSKAIVVKYKGLTEADELLFSNVELITAWVGSKSNLSSVVYKNTDGEIDYASIDSINSQDWRKIALQHNLPLLLSPDEGQGSFLWSGILRFINLSIDDTYFLAKDLTFKGEKIELEQLNSYVNGQKHIRYLGKDELINVPGEVQEEPFYHYIITTVYGNKQMIFSPSKGLLEISYRKDIRPIEIMKLAQDLGANYINVLDAPKV